TNINPNFRATDAYGDTVYNELTAVNVTPPSCTVANTTYCHYEAFFTGIPAAAPTAVSASQVGDQFQISWTPDPARAPVIISSTLTATPVNSTAPVLTATVAGTGTVGAIGPLQPQTTYSITVASVDAGGLGASSSPITATSTPATVAPGAPSGLTAAWTSA